MTGKEYIERGALEDKLNERLKYLREQYGDYDHYTDGFNEAVDAVSDEPAADVVEVVRCKDCSWFIAREEGTGDCDMIFGFTSPVSENGHCYCGERKDGVE